MKTIYLIYKGQGADGGFGDYTPSWDNTPMKLDGEILWFNFKDVAKSIVEILNKQASEEFYRAGFGESYDGNFPIEYETREVTIPDNSPSDLYSFEKILNQEFDSWNWFVNVGMMHDVEEDVKKCYPHLHECKSCTQFGFEDLYFVKSEGICVYCKDDFELQDEFHKRSLDKSEVKYITCLECLGSGEDDEYDAVCSLCNGGGIVKDEDY